MRNVYVLGIGQTIFGKHPQLMSLDLGAAAANLALKDAEINPKAVEVAFLGTIYNPSCSVENSLVRVGISDIPMYQVENACSSGSSAVNLLYREIALGGSEVGIAVGVESLSTFNRKHGKGLLAAPEDMQGYLGLTMPSYFSMLCQRLMSERGATIADICYPSIKNHKNSSTNPFSQYQKVVTLEEVLASPMIVDPITVLQCCPQSDGGAAVILCSEEYYKKHDKKAHRPAVRMASSVISVDGPQDDQFDPIDLPCLVKGARKAYDLAGIGPEDLDVIELHDAFSGEELAAYEMLGLCPKGEGVAFARSGAVEIGGQCPVNPSGGLQSMGHPLGASGVRVVNDVTRQLWGEAGANQVAGAKVGLAQMLGGVGTYFRSPFVAGLHVLLR
jgi:benzoylsuccinyl-CoA thiolase BbsB subunit